MLLLKRTLICACLLASFNGMAAGMVPDTSLLIVNEDKQGASMDVKTRMLKHSCCTPKLLISPDDPKPGLFATQPVVRVDAGKTQRVRFVLKSSAEPLKVEHFKRVILPLSLSVKKIKLKWCLARTFPSLFTRLAWR